MVLIPLFFDSRTILGLFTQPLRWWDFVATGPGEGGLQGSFSSLLGATHQLYRSLTRSLEPRQVARCKPPVDFITPSVSI